MSTNGQSSTDVQDNQGSAVGLGVGLGIFLLVLACIIVAVVILLIIFYLHRIRKNTGKVVN